MAQVSLVINGRTYDIACDDGQEAHIKGLADEVSKRVDELVEAVGQVGEARILLMAALLLADEARGGGKAEEGDEKAIAQELDRYAGRLEAIAERLGEA